MSKFIYFTDKKYTLFYFQSLSITQNRQHIHTLIHACSQTPSCAGPWKAFLYAYKNLSVWKETILPFSAETPQQQRQCKMYRKDIEI